MPDEFDKPLEQDNADEGGEDAEIPLVLAAAGTTSHKNHSEEKTYSAKNYIRPALDRLRPIWLNTWIVARSPNFWTAIATVVIAVSTIFYTVYARRQWKEIHDSSSDTHDLAVAAGKQADAAKIQSEQAKAQTEKMTESLSKTDALITKATEQAAATNKLALETRRQADIAAKSFEAGERPWIGLDHINPPAKIAVDSTPSTSLVYKNWGRGVAFHVMGTYQIRALCGEFPARPNYELAVIPSASLQMPGQPIETGKTSFKAPLTAETMAALKQPGCGLYVHAKITYRDRDGHEHWRHICGEWTQSTDNTFESCTFYNDGDEDYPDGKEP